VPISALMSSTDRTVDTTFTVFIVKTHFQHCVLTAKSEWKLQDTIHQHSLQQSAMSKLNYKPMLQRPTLSLKCCFFCITSNVASCQRDFSECNCCKTSCLIITHFIPLYLYASISVLGMFTHVVKLLNKSCDLSSLNCVLKWKPRWM
jgi:hypothetical protein